MVAEIWLLQNPDRWMDRQTHGWTDGQTDAGYFIVPLPGFFKPAGDKNRTCVNTALPECVKYQNFGESSNVMRLSENVNVIENSYLQISW